MALTTTGFADAFIDLLTAQGVVLTDPTATKTALVASLTDWLGGGDALTASVANRLTALFADFQAELLARTDFWFGSATGGPGADGQYPFTLTDGTSVLNPCLALLRSVMAKGDPGLNARTGIAFQVLGPMAGDELLGLVAVPAMTIDPANIIAVFTTAPAANTAFVVKKNGAAWGTITLAATTGVVSASFSTTTTANGDSVALYAPHSVDAALANPAITIPGV